MNGLYVVAGATGSIGTQLCRYILKSGGTPLLVGRSAVKLKELREELSSADNGGVTIPMIDGVDFSNPSEAGKRLTAELKGETLSGLAYAVGSITIKPLRGSKPEDFVSTYNLNVVGAAECVKASLAGLKKGASSKNKESLPTSSSSSIVLFSSVAARSGLANHSVIGSCKAAVEGLSVSLAAELAPSGIRVNCVAPSLTKSNMAKPMTDNAKIADAIATSHPLPRLGDPADTASAAKYLLSNDSSWTTGIVLPVDGGRSSLLK